MEAALEAQIKKVVMVSTLVTYGDAQWPITEDSQLGAGCASEYAQTKRAGDEVAWQLYRDQNLPLVVIYPSVVLGPHDPKSSGRYIQNLVHGRMPAQILINRPFSFVYVKDVCSAIWQALEKENNIGEKYIVNGANMTWGELNQLICDVGNTSVPKLRLPTPMVLLNARMLTALSSVTKKAPWLDLSIDQVSIMNQGCVADGSKAERELGMHYTPHTAGTRRCGGKPMSLARMEELPAVRPEYLRKEAICHAPQHQNSNLVRDTYLFVVGDLWFPGHDHHLGADQSAG